MRDKSRTPGDIRESDMKKQDIRLPDDRKPDKKPPQGINRPMDPLWVDLLQIVLKIAAICLAVTLLFTFLFGILRYGEDEMRPAIHGGDLVLYYRLDKQYEISDLAVLEYDGKKQARRVVAVAGDTVDITEDGLTINGALREEPDIYFPTIRYLASIDFPITLKEGEIFVLGDDREHAADSRIYGPVQSKDTYGKVMTVIRRRGI